MNSARDSAPTLDLRVGALADAVAERTPAPGAGAVTGVTASLSAALTTMVAQFSDDEATADGCQQLQRRLEPLADADAAAYEAYLAAVRLPRDDNSRAAQLVETLSAATDVPMSLAELTAEVVRHASRLARDGNPRLRGDAVAAALFGAAAVRSAAVLVTLNLDDHSAFCDDPRPGRARQLATEAQAQADGVAA